MDNNGKNEEVVSTLYSLLEEIMKSSGKDSVKSIRIESFLKNTYVFLQRSVQKNVGFSWSSTDKRLLIHLLDGVDTIIMALHEEFLYDVDVTRYGKNTEITFSMFDINYRLWIEV